MRLNPDLTRFNQEYLTYAAQVADRCQNRGLSADCMVIGTSAIIDTELDGAVGMNSGTFKNPFMIWGRYKHHWTRYTLPVSFQLHHTPMDGAHAGRFLARLQEEIDQLKQREAANHRAADLRPQKSGRSRLNDQRPEGSDSFRTLLFYSAS